MSMCVCVCMYDVCVYVVCLCVCVCGGGCCGQRSTFRSYVLSLLVLGIELRLLVLSSRLS